MSSHRRPAKALAVALCLTFLGFNTSGFCGSPVEAQEGTPQGGFRGRLVVDGQQRTLAAENADRLMTPASVLKLVIATAALHHLGSEHRITTHLRSVGDIRDGILQGDVWIEAAGDPTWSRHFFPDNPEHPLDLLAGQIRQLGVDTIDGDLVVSTARFAGRSLPPSRALDEFPYAWATATSSLAINDNSLRLEIAPGPRPGVAARARLLDVDRNAGDDITAGGSSDREGGKTAETSVLRLTNNMTTVSSERHGKGTVDVLPAWDRPEILLRGEYPVSEPAYVIDVSHPQPEISAAQALRRALERQGVRIDGSLRHTSQAPPQASRPLARFTSPPLEERLLPILRESRNWHAEMLLRTLAYEVDGSGRLDTGLEIERRFLVETVGLDAASFVLDDASGVSPYNLVTPRAVAELLRYAWQQPWHRAFLDALARPGQDTLEAWGRLPRLAAKTGTLRHCIGLAGYLDPLQEMRPPVTPTIFVDLIHHDPSPRPQLRTRMARDLRSLKAISADP